MKARARRAGLFGIAAVSIACTAKVDLPFGGRTLTSLSARSIAGGVELRWSPPGPQTLVYGSAGTLTQQMVSGSAATIAGLSSAQTWDFYLGATSVSAPGVLHVRASPRPASPFKPDPDRAVGTLISSGAALAAGDVNGDGYGDLVVGAPQAGNMAAGVVELFLGGPDGISASPAAVLAGLQTGDQLGSSLDLGDLNSDGRPDLLAGARNADSPTSNSGAVYLFANSSATASAVFVSGAVKFAPLDTNSHAGERLRYFGGGAIAVGAPGTPAGAGNGAIYFSGSTAIPTVNGASGEELGNGDIVALESQGSDVLMAGTPGDPLGGSAGGVRILRSSGGAELHPGFVPNGRMGQAIARLGDIAGDDLLAISTPGTASSDTGVVKLYRYSSSTLSSDGSWSASGTGLFGSALAIGDVDGDGIPELAIGAPRAGTNLQGTVMVYRGRPNSLHAQPIAVLSDAVAHDLFGAALAFTDIDGDGYDDLIASAPGDGSINGSGARVWMSSRPVGPGIAMPPAAPIVAGDTWMPAGITFVDPVIGSVHVCLWEWDDGTQAEQVSPCTSPVSASHAYASAGTYHPRLTVTSSDGRAAMAAVRLTVE